MDSRDGKFDPIDKLLDRIRRNTGYYRRCPRCGEVFRSEREYREETRKELFTTVAYGLCSCGYDMEQ